MLKKLLAVLCVMVTLFAAAAAMAEGPLSSKPIHFSGYEFGTTFKNIRNQTRLFCIDFMYGDHSARVAADALDDFAEREEAVRERKIPSSFFARPSETSKVAGYEAETEMWFVYPFRDGIWTFDEDEAVFYAGVYEFFSRSDMRAIRDELQGKLITLYGEPYFTGESLDAVWVQRPSARAFWIGTTATTPSSSPNMRCGSPA